MNRRMNWRMNRRTFLSAAATTAVASTVLTTVGPAAVAMAGPASLEGVIDASQFSGTVLISRGAETILHRGFGEADLSFHIPCGPATRYRIASITKLFTATLVLQLVQEKKLDLDKTIGAYLPHYGGPAKDKSTLRQLLHHTAGIQNFDHGLTSFTDAARTGMPAYQLPHTSDELLAQFASGPMTHAPGAVFDYNNGDFVLLGKILETLEGKPFEAVLQQRILDPLKLESTGPLS